MDFEEQRRMFAMNISGHPMTGHIPSGQQAAAATQQVVQQAPPPHTRILMPEGPLPMVSGTRHGPMDATMATMTSQMAGTQMPMHHTVHQQQLVHHQVIQQQTPQQQQHQQQQHQQHQQHQQQQLLAEVAVNISDGTQENTAALTGVVNEVAIEVKGPETILGLERCDENGGSILEQSRWCLICDKSLPAIESSQEIVNLYKASMTVSQRKLSAMLSRLIGLTLYRAHSDVLCQRCFGLVDQVDGLEIELADTKMELVQQYEATIAHRQPHAKREIERPKLEVDVEWEDSNESEVLDNPDDDPDCTASGAKKRKRKKTKRKGGRPRKIRLTTKIKLDSNNEEESDDRPRKRGRGRPKKKDKEVDEHIPPGAPTKECPACKKVVKKSGRKLSSDTSSSPSMCAKCSHLQLLDEKPSLIFTLLKGATNRGKDLLVDSEGYSYIRDKVNSQSCRWRCTIRNKHLTCCASVQQVGFHPGKFTLGPQKHKCDVKNHGSIEKKKISVEVKKQALARPFTSATTIVNEVMQAHASSVYSDTGVTSLPSAATLCRTANKYRQGYRRAHAPPEKSPSKGVKKSSKAGVKRVAKVNPTGMEHTAPVIPQRPKAMNTLNPIPHVAPPLPPPPPPPTHPQSHPHPSLPPPLHPGPPTGQQQIQNRSWTLFPMPPHYKYQCTNVNY